MTIPFRISCAALTLAVGVFSIFPLASRANEATVIIRGARVLDVAEGRMREPCDVVIAGDRIVSVEAASDKDAGLPADVEVLDGRGRYLIPGLMDAHVHLIHVLDFAHVTASEILPLFLAAGVTSVRDTGDEVVALMAVVRGAELLPARFPRIFPCSPLIDGDPPIHADIGRAITDPGQVPAFVQDMARWNIRTLKIYAGTPREIGKLVIEAGHQHQMMVTAHLGPYQAQDAVADGIDCLEHIWSVFNYVIPEEVKKVPGHRATVDFNQPLAQELIAELAKRQVMVDPTLTVFRNMILLPDLAEVHHHPDNATVPERLREFWPRWTQLPNSPLAERRGELGKYRELTGLLHQAGVPLLAGTDAPEPNVPPGFSLHQELELLVESGLSPAAALRAATMQNAAAVQQQAHLGQITPGRLADLVLLEKNPLEDIRNTRSIVYVVRGGHVTRPEDLLRLVPTK